MTVRRVLATNVDGKSCVIDDRSDLSNAFEHVPGFDPTVLWLSAPDEGLTAAAAPKDGQNVLPSRGGTSLFLVTFPPDSAMAAIKDPAAAGAEYLQRIPGLAETFEQDNSGMHRTDTLDYGIVLEGEIVCAFDEGEVTLKAGDVIVQERTRHGWSNRTERPAKVAFVLQG